MVEVRRPDQDRSGKAVHKENESMEINDDLLQLFIVEKAAYELCYELENRPTWVEVPLRGLLETIEQRAAA